MSYLSLFLSFFKIGTFTFGGGHAMIPFIQEEVLKHSWMSLEQLIDFIAISEGTPGPFAINIATCIGFKLGGFLGALISTIGVIFTSFIVILLIAKYFESHKENKLIRYCMEGIHPVTIGLIGATIISMIIAIFFPNGNILKNLLSIEFLKGSIIFIITMIMSFKKVHPIKIILISAVLGIIFGYIV